MKHLAKITISSALLFNLVSAQAQSSLQNGMQDSTATPTDVTTPVQGTTTLTQTTTNKTLPVAITPDAIQWKDAPNMLPPGTQYAVLEGNLKSKGNVTIRIKMPANYQVPSVYSPTLERITVLSGTVNIGTGNKLDTNSGIALPTGSFAIVPANKHFYLWTSEDSVIQINGMGPWALKYVNKKDDPRNATSTTVETPSQTPTPGSNSSIIGHPQNGATTNPSVPVTTTPTPTNPSSY